MKIVYVAAGAAGMYCGSCLHDNTLAAALLDLGQDALLVPTYTPIRTDEVDVSQRRVMFGGISVFLQQKFSLFRHTPWLLDRLWDRPRLIDWLASRSMSTDAAELGDITVSMLRGEHGNQRKEVEKIVHWLEHDIRPDVVHLSNAMLIGMAHEIRRRLQIPIVCTLSGEDIFLEKLTAPWYQQARDALRERAPEITAFVALNQYYADFMADYAALDPARVHVIPHGLKLAGHGTRPHDPARRDATIGYFARICPDKGLHHLVDAFIRLAKSADLPELRLRVGGYLGRGDQPYLAKLETKLRDAGVFDRYEYVGELNRAEKIEFLQSLDVMSVPTVYRESKGLSILEAWANAVPLVLPNHGTFPELVAQTGGALLHEPEDVPSLVDALRQSILDPQSSTARGLAAQRVIRERFNDRVMAQRTLELYHRVVSPPLTEKVLPS